MSDAEMSSVIVAYLEHRFQNKDMMFLIYYLFLSHIKRYKFILQAYKKYKVVEVGLATTFLAKSVMFLRARALCTGTVQVQKYSDWLSPAKNQHDCGLK